ncbi:MAG TPA: GNAT family protein [Bryobacteraceae bacterium]|jgi:RimJ/RimL family protein N-acetyltransferase
MQPTLNPARRPEKVTLEGRYAKLVPVAAEHAAPIFALISGSSNDHLWDYMGDGPYHDLATFEKAWTSKLTSTDPLFFTILDAKDSAPVGYASLLRIAPEAGSIEVGHILYSPRLQRTPAATEAQYLFAKYVFDELGNRRYEWKCNALNAPSRRAALRYGFQFEGIFRQHMIVKGLNRDTAWFSMLDSEWPARKAAFEAWLDPKNFDESGHQRTPLSRAATATSASSQG